MSVIAPDGRAPLGVPIKWAFALYHDSGECRVVRHFAGSVVLEDGRLVEMEVSQVRGGAWLAKAPTLGQHIVPGWGRPTVINMQHRDGETSSCYLDVVMATDDETIERRLDAMLAFVEKKRADKAAGLWPPRYQPFLKRLFFLGPFRLDEKMAMASAASALAAFLIGRFCR
jgi:hypothetical protein